MCWKGTPAFRDDVHELLASLEANLDALDSESFETGRIAHDLRALIREIRQTLGNASR